MNCPNCGQETPSIMDFCQHCKVDLRTFHEKRTDSMKGKGQGLKFAGKAEVIAGLILTISGGALLIYLLSENYTHGKLWFAAPLIIGLGLFFKGLTK